MVMNTAIIIPARFSSTRLPGKPLAMIAGQTMLQRVVTLSKEAALAFENTQVLVATDDERIVSHCDDIGVESMMTPKDCISGTDRVSYAVEHLKIKPDFILNMQGDAPTTPAYFLTAMIHAFLASTCDAVTPVTQLTWTELDALRHLKKTTPFSGTTAIFDEKTGHAFWFSKNIIPAIRNEALLRTQSDLSPIYRHIGLYGYSRAMLAQYTTLTEGRFEQLEGLEQLRLLEHGFKLKCVPVDYLGRPNISGIDSPEDLLRAQAFFS